MSLLSDRIPMTPGKIDLIDKLFRKVKSNFTITEEKIRWFRKNEISYRLYIPYGYQLRSDRWAHINVRGKYVLYQSGLWIGNHGGFVFPVLMKVPNGVTYNLEMKYANHERY